MTLSLFPDHADASIAYEKAMRDRNRLLRDEITDSGWYAALEAQMAEAGAAISANRDATLARLAAAQAGAQTAFPAASLSLDFPDPQPAREALASALAEHRRRDMAAGRTLIGPHRADLRAIYASKSLPAEQCSTGEQKALLISLILANARALRAETGAAPVLLLDEVAAHLDEMRRAALYAEIEALEAQALMTGTGPELFESLGAQAQRFSVVDDAGTSTVTEVSP
jgi:DNA replication and repair protein RecF